MSAKKLRVLVVDDELLGRERVANLLREHDDVDILGEIDGDTVEVHLADAAAPTLLRENDKSNALYVLMPMRV